MIRVAGASLWLGSRKVLHHACLHIPAGTLGMVVGDSGSGKTSLIRLCAGELVPHEGSVTVMGLDTRRLRGAGLSRLRRATGLITSLPLFPAPTVLESLVRPLLLRGFTRKKALKAAMASLDRLHALALASEHPATLSPGQRQLVVVARALAHRPALVLADEPSLHLSTDEVGAVVDCLDDLLVGGTTLLVTTKVPLAFRHEARTWRLVEGSLTPTSWGTGERRGASSWLVETLLRG